jgi:PadR family transcriptional regulator, regulatory protein PadR
MSTIRKGRTSEINTCPCMGGTLDRLIQPAILAVLAEGPLHGYRLAQRIGGIPGFGGQEPDMSGIYRFLKAMERRGMVVSSWDLPETGPSKKSYSITAEGRHCLERWVSTLEAYRQSVGSLLKVARKAVEGA